MYLMRFAFVKRGPGYELVDLLRRESGDFLGRASAGEECAGGRQHDFIESAYGYDAGDEQFERRIETRLGEFEHRRFGKRPNRFTYTLDRRIYIECAFRHVSHPNAQRA